MQARFLLAVAAIGTACAASAAYTRIETDVSALSGDKSFLSELIRERVEARTPASEGAAFRVRFVPDAAVVGENARVTVRNGAGEVRASRFRGFVAGAGNLLKAIRYGERTFEVPDGDYPFAPHGELRIAYFARHLLNWFMEAPADELCRYIDDLALDGINAFIYQYYVDALDRTTCDAARTEEYLKVSKAMADRIARLDCELVQFGGGNQMPDDSPEAIRAEPNVIKPNKRVNFGFNACPNKPGGLEAMVAKRAKDLAETAGVQVDYFCHWPYDEGGCGCAKCHPWGSNGFLKTVERLRQQNLSVCPKAKTILSTWYFTDEEYAGLWDYLARHDWIDYVIVDDSGSVYPKYPVEHKMPGRAKIITFPEISMWGRSPWGGFGATALPDHLEKLYRQAEPVSHGFMYYGEGLFEDINKWIELCFYRDRKLTVDDNLRTYGAYHFAGADPEDFVRLARLMEATHRFEQAKREDVDAQKALALKMDGMILPGQKRSWRWRQTYLRCLLDAEVFGVPGRQPESATPHFRELLKLYHGERQHARHLAGKHGGWTIPCFEQQQGTLAFENEALRLEFEDASGHLGLHRIVNRLNGAQVAGKAAESNLWEIDFVKEQAGTTACHTVTSRDAVKSMARSSVSLVTSLYWTGLSLPGEAETVDVHLWARLPSGRMKSTWVLNVDSRRSKWRLKDRRILIPEDASLTVKRVNASTVEVSAN